MAVDYVADGGIVHVTLNRPERLNAFSPPFVDELCTALETAIRDDASALVLRGAGRAFCAGHDLKYEEPDAGYTAVRRDIERLQDVTRLIRRAPFPVIAAVHGYALGAGCELALCSDYVVAADDAVFGFPEVSVGLSITGGISHILPLVVGLMKAKQLVLLGERFSAHEALSLGLISQVVAADDLQKAAEETARTLAALPHKALGLAKLALDRGAQSDLSGAMELETLHGLETRGSDEAALAAASFSRRTAEA
jgi:2-(1,2-epoxy-1,2-dihydrophenyl)acetyl-CoA isomerase